MVKPERRTDSQYPLANLQLAGFADLCHRQVPGLDLEQGHVAALVLADDLGLELAAIAQPHDDLVGVLDHVVVGNHVAVLGNNESRTQRLGIPETG